LWYTPIIGNFQTVLQVVSREVTLKLIKAKVECQEAATLKSHQTKLYI
jgi:hypothetical protein